MNKGLLLRIFVCIIFFGGCFYSYLDMQNSITSLRIRIPELSQSVRRIEEENTHLHYEIEAFENPQHLMSLAQENAFAYLKYPFNQEVITMSEGDTLPLPATASKEKKLPSITFASGQP